MNSNDILELQCRSCYAPLNSKKQMTNIVTCEYCGTENVLSKDIRVVVAEESNAFQVRLYKAISADFDSLDELSDLVMRLNGEIPLRISFDNLAGSTSGSKSRELVLWCGRRKLLQPLVDVCLSLRPHMDI